MTILDPARTYSKTASKFKIALFSFIQNSKIWTLCNATKHQSVN